LGKRIKIEGQMGYFPEFQKQIGNRDFGKFIQLWEEYCRCDSVDIEECRSILQLIKSSELVKPFGKYVEMGLPLLQRVPDEEDAYEILRLLIDLETTNSLELAEIALSALKKKHGQEPQFNERLRLVGLRTKENFQGAITYYTLLAHMQKGKFLFHASGWGTGEIMEVSQLREQLTVEFENVPGLKHLTFANAFRALIPISDEHFLARRFADPDKLEKEAQENPVEIIKVLLRDLGPKTAAEIKDELCELVIPEKDWTKWWQNARTKLKKDTLISCPESLKEPFFLRKEAVTHEEQFQKNLTKKSDLNEIILTCYNFARDYASKLKNPETKNQLEQTLKGVLADPRLTSAQELQVALFSEHLFDKSIGKSVQEQISQFASLEPIIEAIEIVALKKQAIQSIKQYRNDWQDIYLTLFFVVQQGPLRDFLLKELMQDATRGKFQARLEELVHHPITHPDLFFWYFQKALDNEEIPFHDVKGRYTLFDSFLVLLNKIENSPSYSDLAKKMYNFFINKRYLHVREIFENAPIEFIKEFLLLSSKCHIITEHDKKNLRSLAAVQQPMIHQKDDKENAFADLSVIWTTEAGYNKIQDRIKEIALVETIDNSREIEAARAHGDLRENAEYKYAVERRSRLQSELKTLSSQLQSARILQKDDVHPQEIGVGSIVDTTNAKGDKITYQILGPWDASPDDHILSYQSKFAQAMMGKKVGDKFAFREDEFKITGLKSYFG
jgi:transcription elongation factor GreA-like protein/transcription elongation GreA/GreB family factor